MRNAHRHLLSRIVIGLLLIGAGAVSAAEPVDPRMEIRPRTAEEIDRFNRRMVEEMELWCATTGRDPYETVTECLEHFDEYMDWREALPKEQHSRFVDAVDKVSKSRYDEFWSLRHAFLDEKAKEKIQTQSQFPDPIPATSK